MQGEAQDVYHMQSVPIQSRWAAQVSPSNALPEYPRPQLVRKQWTNLNGLWEYAITDSVGRRPEHFEGKILVPYAIESALSGVKKALQPNQRLWYRRVFEQPALKTGERLLLHFGAVDYQASVYVNGTLVGGHTGGYQEFTLDVTEALKAGENDLTVMVTDPTDKGINPKGKQVLEPGGIMYTATSGIWQTVWLEPVAAVHIDKLSMTPDVDGGFLSLTVKSAEDVSGYTVVATAAKGGSVTGGVNEALRLPVAHAHLWSPEDPYLYDLSVKLLYKGKVVDVVQSYFGMRKIAIAKDEQGVSRIFLNGKYTYNLGVLDQGFWPDGIYTAPTDEALRYDVEAIRSMGFNTIRKHIKIEPARWYYWCDKLGMLVWQDMPYPATETEAGRREFEAENVVNMEQLHNYPSIVCWVLFNEGWNSYDQQRLTEWMKQEDPSRIINGHTGGNYCGNCPQDSTLRWISSDMADIHDYPGPGIAPAVAGKAMVLGEWGGVHVTIPGHVWNPEKGFGYIDSKAEAFAGKYDSMMVQLKGLERRGLSASIYTQPFDVEGEENGLMTYDRAVFKIPVDKIRSINVRMYGNK